MLNSGAKRLRADEEVKKVVRDWLAQKLKKPLLQRNLCLNEKQEEVHSTWLKSLYCTYFCNKSLHNFSNFHVNELFISNHWKFIVMSITDINLLVQQCSVLCPNKINLDSCVLALKSLKVFHGKSHVLLKQNKKFRPLCTHLSTKFA
jgi:hypothetical protein